MILVMEFAFNAVLAFLQDLSRVEAAVEALCKSFHPGAFSNVDQA